MGCPRNQAIHGRSLSAQGRPRVANVRAATWRAVRASAGWRASAGRGEALRGQADEEGPKKEADEGEGEGQGEGEYDAGDEHGGVEVEVDVEYAEANQQRELRRAAAGWRAAVAGNGAGQTLRRMAFSETWRSAALAAATDAAPFTPARRIMRPNVVDAQRRSDG